MAKAMSLVDRGPEQQPYATSEALMAIYYEMHQQPCA